MPIENISGPEKFTSFLKKHNNVLCLYYWKNCGHCIAFAPLWNKVTQQYKDSINVINVELECVRKLDDKYRVMSFPTVMVYKNGERYAEFIKNRTEKDLHAFIQKYALQKPRKSSVTKQNKNKKPQRV